MRCAAVSAALAIGSLLHSGFAMSLPPGTAPDGASSVPVADGIGSPSRTRVIARWLGDEGRWSEAVNWMPHRVPGIGPYSPHVVIGSAHLGTRSADSHVVLDVDAIVPGLRISAGDELVVADGFTLSLAGGLCLIQNAGSIELDAHEWPTRLTVGAAEHASGTAVLRGGGTLVLNHEANAIVEGHGGDERLVNEDDHAIVGAGWLGNGRLALTNHGVIRADVPMAALTISPHNGGFGDWPMRNTGTIEATNGGWLTFSDAVVDNAGVIHAGVSSFVQIDGAEIHGGVISSAGSGIVRNMFAPAALHSVTNLGSLMVGPTTIQLGGVIENFGQFDVVGDLTLGGGQSGPASRIELADDGSGAVTFTGTGAMTLLSSEFVGGGPAQPVTLINDVDHVMTGASVVGHGDVPVVNLGLMIADEVSAMRFNPGLGRSVINEGVMCATGTGGIVLVTGTFENNGVVEVHEGSKLVCLPGVQSANNVGGILVGGEWEVRGAMLPTAIVLSGPNITTNAADVTLEGPGALFPRFDTIAANHGAFRVLGGRTFTTAGTLHNWGDIVVGAGSLLEVSGAYIQKPGGTMEVHFYGHTAGDHGCLKVQGVASLAGKLELAFADGVQLPAGETLMIVEADALSGSFSSIIKPANIEVVVSDNTVKVTNSDHVDTIGP